MRKKYYCLWNISVLTITLFFNIRLYWICEEERIVWGEGEGGTGGRGREESSERCQHTLQQKLSSACPLSLFEGVPISCLEEMLEISVLKVEWNVQKVLSASVKIQISSLGLLSSSQNKIKSNDFLFYSFKCI